MALNMRGVIVLVLCIAPSVANSWPWPGHKNTTTTTTAPPVRAFEQGVASTLGFEDISSCYKDTQSGLEALWEAAEDYRKGGLIEKSKALEKFASGIHQIVDALQACSDSITDASKYKRLIQELEDPQYYTMHNALTLALNLAEDRKMLAAFAQAWQKEDFRTAGVEITSAMLDVLEHPGLPSTNGTEAIEIAYGIAEGFTSDVDIKCFVDVGVVVPALVGGVLDLLTVVKIPTGLESLFHGVEDIVPTYRACLADKTEIMHLLQEAGDFKNPAALAKKIAQNFKDNAVDISLETASAVLAYKGKEWEHFGLQIGKIFGKAFVISANVAAVVV